MPEAGDPNVLLDIVPVTAAHWPGLETLFGKSGAFAGCWCMFWRLNRAKFKQLKGEGTKAVLRDMVLNNDVPGIIAYEDHRPVGWCSVGPREDFAALENSRILKRIDDQPVWSIVCFFVTKSSRGKGVMSALLSGALKYAGDNNAKIVEGYPLDLQSPLLVGKTLKSFSGCMGIASIFSEAGFIEVGRASETQLLMRYLIE